MTKNRCLHWDGCVNIRDLGGLRTHDGRVTRWGAVVRSDHPAGLTSLGWQALCGHGIRTVISLRTHGQVENHPDSAPRPAELTSLCVEIEDVTDREFAIKWGMSDLWSTPYYYLDALERWPQRHAEALLAIARAQPGGVLIHCKRGVDRTGIMTLLLLTLAGVEREEIIADYELSVDPQREEILAREHTCTRDVLNATLDWLDIDDYLRKGGLSAEDQEALKTRLL